MEVSHLRSPCNSVTWSVSGWISMQVQNFGGYPLK